MIKSTPENSHPERPSEIHLNEEYYRCVIESAEEGIWILDLNLNIIFVNSAACEILGYSREEIIGKTPFNFLVEGQNQAVEEMAKELHNGTRIIHERQFYHKSGSKVWVVVSSAGVFDSRGKHIANLGMFTDITEHKKAELALEESESKYHQLVENAGEGIIVVQDGKIQFFNKKFEEITGYSGDELTQRPFTQFICPEDREMVLERHQMRLQGRTENALYEFRVQHKNESIRWVKINAVYITWNNRPATLSFLTDITANKTAEQTIHQREQQLKEERERFTRKLIEVQEDERKRIARELHDDAAPNLALITLEIDHLLGSEETLSEKAKELLLKLREDTVITQKEIRRYSHELRPGVLDELGLEAALESLVEDMLERSRLRIDLDIEGQENRLPSDAEVAFFRIAQEALNNIRKHAEATQITLCLKYSPDRVKLSIKDNGKGFTVTSARRHDASGGLGLIGMKERAKLIGAKLTISSKPGKGTTVMVGIPVKNK